MLPESETYVDFCPKLSMCLCVCVYFKDCRKDIIIDFLLICSKRFLMLCKFSCKNNTTSGEIAVCSNIEVNNKKSIILHWNQKAKAYVHNSFWKYCLILIRSQLTLELQSGSKDTFWEAVPVSLKIRTKRTPLFQWGQVQKACLDIAGEKYADDFLFFSLNLIKRTCFFVFPLSRSFKASVLKLKLWWRDLG